MNFKGGILAMSKVFEFNSNGSFTVTVTDYHVRIQPKVFLNFNNNGGSKCEKSIPINSITEIQFQEPFLTTGYVQFAYSSASKLHSSTMAAVKDEIKITFLKEEFKQAGEMVKLIESKLNKHQKTLQRSLFR